MTVNINTSAFFDKHPLVPAVETARVLTGRLRAAVKGRDDVIRLILVALFADGHVLLEDYPGSGKTTLAKTLGESITGGEKTPVAAFRRVQFTPDLLPGDITGVSIFDLHAARFEFRPGPVFAHVLLADEINRTSPKVQSAMLEAMGEKQVTVDNVTWPLDQLFFVIATQNPHDLAGTYPLPVAQLDRFLFKIRMDYIDRESEIDVLATRRERRSAPAERLVERDELVSARHLVDQCVHVHPAIHQCLVDCARNLRGHGKVLQGLSTRSLVLMVPALQTAAMLSGRDYVSTEDIGFLAPHVFEHRLTLVPGAGDIRAIVRECLAAPLEKLTRMTLSTPAKADESAYGNL